MSTGLPVGNSTFEYNSSANITDAATHLVKSGPGLFVGVAINTKGSGSATVKVYDGLTAGGELLATIDATSGPAVLRYNIAVQTGICVVTAATAGDVTILFR